VFSTYAMTPRDWIALVVLSAAIVPMIEFLKLLERRGVIGKNLGPMSRRG